ncbi:MAG: hypothetical protein KatS3mg032_1954 [Cyclobacteriaceae bacterium]|nr:MAG: hypothetical protein KatS3mg032_1954 [Cyclobacteriaceae bacterium]
MKTLFFCIVLIGLVSCTKNKEHQAAPASDDPGKALYDRVMDIHDEVMPRMDEIMRLKRELKEALEKGEELVPEKRQALEAKIQQLDSAGKAMMEWMRQFNPEEYTGEDLQKYLEAEQERIIKVKEQMLEAIAKAKEN